LSAEREVLAQVIGHGDASLDELVLQKVGDERNTATATRAGPGDDLHLSDIGQSALSDGVADRRLADVVAAAHPSRRGQVSGARELPAGSLRSAQQVLRAGGGGKGAARPL